MTQSHFVTKARKPGKTDDGKDIAIGQSYYWWKFNFRKTIHKSLTAPTPRQLTQNEFQHAIFDISDNLSALTIDDIRGGDMSSVTDEIETLRSEQEDKLGNMPDSLQESPSGEILQNRADSLQEWQDEIEGVNIPDEFAEPEPESREGNGSEEDKAILQQKHEQWLKDKEEYETELREALDEIRQTSYNGE